MSEWDNPLLDGQDWRCACSECARSAVGSALLWLTWRPCVQNEESKPCVYARCIHATTHEAFIHGTCNHSEALPTRELPVNANAHRWPPVSTMPCGFFPQSRQESQSLSRVWLPLTGIGDFRMYPHTPLSRQNSENSDPGIVRPVRAHRKLRREDDKLSGGLLYADPGYRAAATPKRSAAMFDAALLSTGDSFVPM